MNAREIAEAVSKVIELDAIDLAGITLSQEQFYERLEKREMTDKAESNDNPVVQAILMPLEAWDGEIAP